MTTCKLLSLDESGKAPYQHSSKLFVLSGAVMLEKHKVKIDNKMRKLKIKYFSNEEIVFHSRDMSRKKGPFSVLRDPKKEINFWAEFISIVNDTKICFIFIVVDKDKAKKKRWQSKTILKRSYIRILENFVSNHLQSGTGKIITESDPSQDFELIQAHNKIQCTGTSDGKISPKDYRRKITSISLVSKSNLDIDIQMADALAPIAGMIYEFSHLNKKAKMTKAERMKKRLIDRKLSDKENSSVYEILIK